MPVASVAVRYCRPTVVPLGSTVWRSSQVKLADPSVVLLSCSMLEVSHPIRWSGLVKYSFSPK